jgi:CRP-like cAMP-binding protein
VDKLETLKNVFIFRGLTYRQLDSAASSLVEQVYKKSDYVFWEEDPPESLWILHSGKVKLTKQSESGKETILGIVSPGETFGELALFDGRPLPFSAQAMEPSTVLSMPRSGFLGLLKEHQNVAIEIIIELSHRLRDAQAVIKGMAADRVENRIVEVLLKLAEKVGRRDEDGVRIGILLTRQDIADMVGSTVETTIRILSKLSKKGLIATRGKSLIIRDVDALTELIDGNGDEI